MLLMIDNYDSFTHNVVRYFRELNADVEVVRNDAISVADIANSGARGLLISPGPCTPNEAGISLKAIQTYAGKLPILGVCLGHQAIGQVFGGRVVHAEQVKHGKTSSLHHRNTGLFKGLPNPFRVARYHSLVVEHTTLPEQLVVDAWTESASGQIEVMGMHHRDLPIWGVQYHPEAIETEHGHALFANFLRQTTNND